MLNTKLCEYLLAELVSLEDFVRGQDNLDIVHILIGMAMQDIEEQLSVDVAVEKTQVQVQLFKSDALL